MRACAILTTILVVGAAKADDKIQPLAPIDTKAKNIEMAVPKDGSVLKPTEITTVEELTKSPLFGKVAVEKVKKEVNFEKEKLVVFAWNGPEKHKLDGELVIGNKKAIARFNYIAIIGSELQLHFALFAVPKDSVIVVRDLRTRTECISTVKEIPTTDLKIAFPEKPGGASKPEIITSAAELAQHTPLKAAGDGIKKQVDFEKEKLVFIAWFGSSGDQFSMTVRLSDDKLILAFQASPGLHADRYKHLRVFVVPKDVGVETGGGK